ncbi:amidohydrolase [Lachnospiraceae bacterium ZAX-1]
MRDELYQELIKIRHHIHRHPEVSGEEYETTAYLTAVLEKWGLIPASPSLETGLVVEIGKRSTSDVIALRADIDALPIEEKTGLAYASATPGTMHACGHDFHQTALLGAAYELKQQEEEIPGLVRLIFQAGEESVWGSRQVIKAGYLDDVRVIVGFHNHPAYPVGTIALKEGPIMAGVDQFFVTVEGKGSHAAEPHLGIDVPTAIATVVSQLQTIVSRSIDPRETSVLSVTHIETGSTWNALPDMGFFEGTTRTFSEKTRAMMKERFFAIIRGAELSYGVKIHIDWKNGPNVTYNDPAFTKKVVDVCKQFATLVEAVPSNGGEDFATYLEKAPGVFAFIGVNGEEQAPGWHHSNFVVKEEALKTAVEYYVQTALALR